MQPATFVQQVNTLSGLIDGRVALNIVAGSSAAEQRGYGDFLDHDERYARADEFLEICHAFWRKNGEVVFKGDYFQVESGNSRRRSSLPIEVRRRSMFQGTRCRPSVSRSDKVRVGCA